MLEQVPELPTTLHELTMHGGASLSPSPMMSGARTQPLRVDHLTQLKRLVLTGSAYRGLDVTGRPADPADAEYSITPLLPASLRMLALQDCSDAADALRVLRHPRLRPPPGATLSLHATDSKNLQWPVYLDTSPRPLPVEADRGARLPAGFAALSLCIPQVLFNVHYDLGWVPIATPDAAELLCRLLVGAPRSYTQLRLFLPRAGGLTLHVSGELIRKTACLTAPVVPGNVERRFETAHALANRARRWACQLGLRAGTAMIDGEDCVAVSRPAA